MKDFLKQHLKQGKTIVFDNERTFTDDSIITIRRSKVVRINGEWVF